MGAEFVSRTPGGLSFDVAVIGAGVVGCAVAREFALGGLRVVLIERGTDILSGASKANSAILHTGFDAVPGSLEARCMRAGHRRYHEIHAQLGLPLEATGALLVAWSDAELAKLPAILAQAHANGVTDAHRVGRAEMAAIEPGLAADARGGIVIPGESLIDPWSAPLAYALQAIAHGAQVWRQTEVTGGQLQGDMWRLDTARGPVTARVVVNCAGLFGDLVEAIARPSPFAIRPRKGQFVVLDKTARRLVRGIVLPVPNERTKGVLIAPTVFGNLIVGPTAEDQEDRHDATTDETTLQTLLDSGRRMVPALAAEPVTAAYAGLRPATQIKDFVIEALPRLRWITVGGIRSTGLTASLGIAAHVADLHGAHFGLVPPPAPSQATPACLRVPWLAETGARPWAQPGRDEIVCHCEMVTRAEIVAALEGPLPAGDLGGLKRRTRCMMGRCQGFYCARRILELAGPRLPGLAMTAGEAAP